MIINSNLKTIQKAQSYNLFNEYNKDIHPTGKKVYADILSGPNIGIPDQSEKGIYDVFTGEVIAKSNVSSFVYEGKYFLQVTNISDEPCETVTTQFCSKIPKRVNELPNATLRACEFVPIQNPSEALKLQDAILSVYASEFLQPDFECLTTCCDLAASLYRFSRISDESKSPIKPSINSFDAVHNLAPDYNADFGVDSTHETECINVQYKETFYQNLGGISYYVNDELIHIPVTINTFIFENRIFIQISELADNEEDTFIVQFSSMLSSEVEQSATKQAEKFINSRYLEFSVPLLKVLSAVTFDVLYPGRNIITPALSKAS